MKTLTHIFLAACLFVVGSAHAACELLTPPTGETFAMKYFKNANICIYFEVDPTQEVNIVRSNNLPSYTTPTEALWDIGNPDNYDAAGSNRILSFTSYVPNGVQMVGEPVLAMSNSGIMRLNAGPAFGPDEGHVALVGWDSGTQVLSYGIGPIVTLEAVPADEPPADDPPADDPPADDPPADDPPADDPPADDPPADDSGPCNCEDNTRGRDDDDY